MKILIVPDSFKGTLTSKEVGNIIKKRLECNLKCEIESLEFSDGGEGFSLAMQNACNGDLLNTYAYDVFGKSRSCNIITTDDTAIIDCATASGLQKRKDIMIASSYGTGQLIKFAYDKGFQNIILGLGGTGCCDGGIGILEALGVKFKDIEGNIISKIKPNDFDNLYGVDFKSIVKDIGFTYACDVKNVYYGKNGAAYVFAPQKGANNTQVEKLDNGLKRLNAFLPNDVSKLEGAGAAGGICGTLYSIYGGEIKSGFDVLSEVYKLEDKIRDADYIITGEGHTDNQTLMGKLPYKISQLCKKYNKPCFLISGGIDDVKICDYQISLVDKDISLEYCLENSEEVLFNKSGLLLKYILN